MSERHLSVVWVPRKSEVGLKERTTGGGVKPGDMRYYHLSAENLGAEVTLTPRIPSNGAIGEERETPRISVALDIEDCILGKTWVHATGRTFYVYELRSRVDVEEPPRWAVPDSGDTREHWVTEPARFRRVGTVVVPPQEPWGGWPDGPVFTFTGHA